MNIPNAIRTLIARVRAYPFRRPEALDVTAVIAVVIAVLVGLGLVVWLVKGPTIIVNNGPRPDLEAANSPITGLPCPDPTLRPVAVMLASDPEARPLSGLRDADIVIEAPVTPGGITRLMAVYQCAEPEEIGSIRSARATFIPFVLGFQAIYAHWGGERDVLDDLNAGIADNVDALAYEGTVYYRKSGVPRPHNGFTTLARVREQADKLGYQATASLDPFAHTTDARSIRNLGSLTDTIALPAPSGSDVVFRYDSATNTYPRWRANDPEIDRLNDRQVAPSVVIVMEVDIERVFDQYVDLVTVGEGSATIHQAGRRVSGTWHKPSAGAPLTFTNADGKTIAFTPGQIWVSIQTAP